MGDMNAGGWGPMRMPFTPRLKSVLVRSSSGWHLKGLHVSPEFAPTYENKTMVTVESQTWGGPLDKVTVEACTLQSVADASKWTASDWDQKSANGFQVGGTDVTIKQNVIRNVNFGISVGATKSLVEHNTVDGFAGDGLRGLGDHTVFQYNTIKNCYDVNANHDDGFQSWSVGNDGKVGTGQVTGVVLRGNRIINYEDPNQPFRGALQGIGMFDGTFVDWVIENNVIITDHYHGITLLGAKGCRVVNNTVLDPNTVKPGPPWIKIDAHKDGTAPTGCTVRNNLAPDFASAATGVTEDHNLKVTAPATYFVDPAGYDLHLLPGCPAIDQGSTTLAPKIDIEGVSRPQGAGFDVGAHEWTSSPPKPDAGPPDAATDSAAPAADGSVPQADGVAAPDSAGPAVDGSTPMADSGGPAGDSDPNGQQLVGGDGCDCRLGRTPSAAPLVLGLLVLFLLFRRGSGGPAGTGDGRARPT